jgi:hypothetical protein
MPAGRQHIQPGMAMPTVYLVNDPVFASCSAHVYGNKAMSGTTSAVFGPCLERMVPQVGRLVGALEECSTNRLLREPCLHQPHTCRPPICWSSSLRTTTSRQ